MGRVISRTLKAFYDDQMTHHAAALTYYAVLSLFPALVVVMSLLGVIGQGERTADAVLGIIDDVSPGAAVDVLRPHIVRTRDADVRGRLLVALGATATESARQALVRMRDTGGPDRWVDAALAEQHR